MAKFVFKKSTVAFSVVIILLMGACIGLLVALLKSQQTADQAVDPEDTTTLSPPRTTPKEPSAWDTFRLPSHIVPLHYDLKLKPEIGENSAHFNGEVTIKVQATKPTHYFALHKSMLDITECHVRNATDGSVVQLDGDPKYYETNELYVLELKDEVGAGDYELYFSFNGILNGTIVGFYNSTYTDPITQKEKYLATSKFQPTYARQAFPCFDEPTFKSEFTITLEHQSEYKTILSNMPAINTVASKTNGWSVTKFQTSVPMVTYLVCFIVCDFDYASDAFPSEGFNKTFRVFASPHQVNKTQFALDVGVDVIKYYADYFGISYPLPKQDMIAIPDFSSGAMEHWGLITYRETNLLYDENVSSNENKQRIAAVIAHELAHMWFGNLVTMEWWDNLWLNEGFASYMEYKAVDQKFPDWKMLSQFLTADLQPVMLLDATTSSHPIIQQVNSSDQITEIFDTISYNKGAAVLRMLEFFIGEKNFQTGISNYLKKYEFSTARTEQLWAEMTYMTKAKNALNISSIMDTWTKQMGFPYITIIRGDDPTKFTAKQKRFLISGSQEKESDHTPSEFKYIWAVPLSYVTSNGDEDIVWLNGNEEYHFTIKSLQSKDDWVKFNRDQTGYYIVNYETREWEKIINILEQNHTAFTPADRANLIFDTFQLAENGILEYEIALNMTAYLQNETELTPWETAYNSFVRLGHILVNTDVGYGLKVHVRTLTDNLYRRLGWEPNESHTNSLLQSTIVGLACNSGNQDCLDKSLQYLDAWVTNKRTNVPFNLKRIVLQYGMSSSINSKIWEEFWNMYMEEKSASERSTLLYGLAHSPQEEMIKKLLDYALDPTKIRSQDFFSVLSYVAGNPVGLPIVWNFVKKEWKQLEDRFTINNRYLGRAVKNICDYFTTEEELKSMEKFFKENPNSGAGAMARSQALQNVRNNIRWLKTNKEDVGTFIDKQGFDMPWNNHRLTRSVTPKHYDLLLHPDLDTNQFKGHVTIKVSVSEETSFFVVHSNKLKITKSEIRKNSTGEIVPSHNPFLQEENQFLITPLKKTAEGNEDYELYYEFTGMLNGSLVGFYKSSYEMENEDGEKETRHLATSQFQSTYARQAFPCFDEPSFKSTFNVILVHPNNLTALSNMPVLESKAHAADTNLTETHFEKSVPMVTYLVCVIVCDFDKVSSKTNKNVDVQVFAAPDRINQTKYALDAAVKTLQYFENYFNIPYPLPKLDMIAIPDFQAGAMENWGLVTYRETHLLFNESETPAYNQLRIAAVIGHELAHMWFGNLVTMKWWDNLWLNEGFASYIEYKSIEKVNSSWEIDSQFFLEDMSRVVVRDATSESHPIVQNVDHPNQITALFDAISYSKGASVLRMLEFFMGSENFRNGLTNYLNKYSFINAVTEDLWAELQAVYDKDGENITTIMDTWTRQMGYPCVNVKRGEGGNLTVSQTRFLLDSEEPSNDTTRFLLDSEEPSNDTTPVNYVWKIPLNYRTENNSASDVIWLTGETTDISSSLTSSEWVKFNVNHTGYYIVNYNDDWDNLIQLLNKNPKLLSPADRSNLISDAFLLARGELMPYNKTLELSKYLKQEDHFVPWSTAISSLTFIAELLEGSQAESEIKIFLENLSVNRMKALYWEDNGDHLTKRLRAAIMSLACKSGNRDCLKNAGNELQRWLDGNRIAPNLRSTIYCYGMQEIGDESVWDKMWQRYRNEISSQEKLILLRGLSCTRDKVLLESYLNLAWSEDNVRKQDYTSVLSYIASNPHGLQLVWDYYRNNWTQLVDRFTLTNSFLGNAFKSICSHFKSQERLEEMTKFINDSADAGAGETSRKEAFKTVGGNIKWLRSHRDNVTTWLKDQNQIYSNIRLPRHIIPVHYDLSLQPDLDVGTFNGSVDITVELKKPTAQFIVHIRSLNITETKVTHEGQELEIKKEFHFEENEYWVIDMAQEAAVGSYQLSFRFDGTMLNKLLGFYRSTYRNSKNETRHIATSQFQSTSAREAFPCFDEPSFKSTFTITLVHRNNYIALSNMPPEKGQEKVPLNDRSDLLKTTFQKTSKPMVTYLVCVIVCDFESTEIPNVGRNKIPLRVFVSPDNINMAEYSLKAGKRVLETLEEYFNISYPLPKLDMIGIPDFSAGAMENWGLITYREIYLLFNEMETPPSTQFSMYMIIAHEIAHMWFGNLVTMEWWDDLWLNEGFATYMAYKVTAMNNPDWNGEGFFLSREMNRASRKDATRNSNPIVRTIDHPHDIAAAFDSVTYGKGGSILRMLENYIGEEKMRSGLENYLTKYKDKNAVTDELWEELRKESNVDVKGIMNTWTRQMGYPVVNVRYDDAKVTATVKQKRFLLNPDSETKDSHISPYWYNWKIPLVYEVLNKNVTKSYLMTEVQEEIELKVNDISELKWNPNQKGYYLVNYDEKVWSQLTKNLETNYKDFSALDRSNLLNDAFMLASSGDLNYVQALDLTKYMTKEDDYIAWSTAAGELLYIMHLIQDKRPDEISMKNYLKHLTDDKMKELGWNDNSTENLNKRMLRSTVVDVACRADNQECLNEAEKLLKAFIDTKHTKLPAALTSRVYRYGLANDNDGTMWDKLWEIYLAENSAQEKNDLLYGLAFTKNEAKLNKYLEMAEDEATVRKQDYSLVMSSVSSTPEGLEIAWNYMKNNYQKLVDRFDVKDSKLGGIVQNVCSKFMTEDKLQEIKELFTKFQDAGAGAENRRATLEAVSDNIQWKQKYETTIKKWLDAWQTTTTPPPTP